MAFVPLMAAGQAFDQLLAQMAPNTAPAEPSLWPLAIGYWLVIASLFIAIIAVVTVYLMQRPWRRVKTELKRLQSLTDSQQQLVELHQLLRWLSIYRGKQPKAMTPNEFGQWVAAQNGGQPPEWLNKHYQTWQETAPIDWPNVNSLIKTIYKGGRS